jgi:hypothetical protein
VSKLEFAWEFSLVLVRVISWIEPLVNKNGRSTKAHEQKPKGNPSFHTVSKLSGWFRSFLHTEHKSPFRNTQSCGKQSVPKRGSVG